MTIIETLKYLRTTTTTVNDQKATKTLKESDFLVLFSLFLVKVYHQEENKYEKE